MVIGCFVCHLLHATFHISAYPAQVVFEAAARLSNLETQKAIREYKERHVDISPNLEEG